MSIGCNGSIWLNKDELVELKTQDLTRSFRKNTTQTFTLTTAR
jgi:exosome complex RNA-binding protein Rrp4